MSLHVTIISDRSWQHVLCGSVLLYDILDAIDRNRRSVTIVGSGSKKNRGSNSSRRIHSFVVDSISRCGVLCSVCFDQTNLDLSRLGSGFWLFLPTDLNFLCLIFGSVILYLQHGYIPGALFAEIWVAGSMLCYMIFETTLRVSGISDFMYAIC